MFSTIGNLFITIVKFVLSLTIPSLWFFINAGFGFVLGICRLLTIKKYNKIKKLKDNKLIKKEEYKYYYENGVMLILLGISYFFVSSYTNTNMHEYITYLVALIAFSSIME